MHRDNYEKATIESLNDIKTQCEHLLHEADKTHKYQTSHANYHLIGGTSYEIYLQEMVLMGNHPAQPRHTSRQKCKASDTSKYDFMTYVTR